MAAMQLTRTHRILIGVVIAGAVIIAGIGFAGSYAAVRALALKKGFGDFSLVFPIGIDAGICVLLALDLLLTWIRIPFPLLRQTAWLLTAATIAFNGAAAWPDPLGVGMHAVIPVLFVVTVEAARHAVGRIADITADRHMEGVRITRWLLSPLPTFKLWRRMKLWELRSYEQAVGMEQDRLIYQARLQARYGRAWRRKAPVEALMPLRLARIGVPLAQTAPEGLAAAGIDPVLLPPVPQPALAAAASPVLAREVAAPVEAAELPSGGQPGAGVPVRAAAGPEGAAQGVRVPGDGPQGLPHPEPVAQEAAVQGPGAGRVPAAGGPQVPGGPQGAGPVQGPQGPHVRQGQQGQQGPHVPQGQHGPQQPVRAADTGAGVFPYPQQGADARQAAQGQLPGIPQQGLPQQPYPDQGMAPGMTPYAPTPEPLVPVDPTQMPAAHNSSWFAAPVAPQATYEGAYNPQFVEGLAPHPVAPPAGPDPAADQEQPELPVPAPRAEDAAAQAQAGPAAEGPEAAGRERAGAAEAAAQPEQPGDAEFKELAYKAFRAFVDEHNNFPSPEALDIHLADIHGVTHPRSLPLIRRMQPYLKQRYQTELENEHIA
ncbi:DUF2637 domain-containing protein [Streptomyces sp. NPDC101132]|uniref:DUF2637 domain-containing protein n=1 Tax=Streptomyces sp. NPDC101132 TaxID=3366110 RepID=UPI003829E5C0